MTSASQTISPAGAAIELTGVTKTYAGAPAVDGLTVRFAPGELCCLLGPSGCGKSTTLRLIAGLEQPDAGTVRIRGRDMRGLTPQQRNLGFVFQNYALFPHMNVRENVAYGLRSRGGMREAKVREAARDALSMVRLDGYGDRRVHELSGGEQQRVALARAFVNRPRLTLLDEPFSSLDALTRERLQLALLTAWRARRVPYVLVTHSLEEAVMLGQRIMVMSARPARPVAVFDNPGFGDERIRDTDACFALLKELRHTVEAQW